MTNEIDPQALIRVSREAGAEILRIYGTEFTVDVKEDQSPLTEADRAANDLIVRELAALHPDIPVISEETRLTGYAERKDWDCFWLVDPLDGTKEFVKRNGEFTVNIALVRGNTPEWGFVYQPVGDRLYWGRVGEGAWLIDRGGEPRALEGGPHYSEKDEVTVVASRSHRSQDVEDFVGDLKKQGKRVEFLSSGSSLKMCLVASGEADVYPRFGPTSEWDTGAAHAVAVAAGRRVLARDTREPLVYNKENLLNPHFLVE